MEEQLATIAACKNPKQREAMFIDAVIQAVQRGDVEGLTQFAMSIDAGEAISIATARIVLDALCGELTRVDDQIHIDIANRLLVTLNLHIASLQKQITTMRENLATVLERRQQWAEAADVYSQIRMDNTGPILTDEDRLQVYVKTAELYLKANQPLKAGSYINRARVLIKNDSLTPMAPMTPAERRFKKCYAKVLESKKRFLEACTQYYGLSINPPVEEALKWLSHAVTSAILAPAGPHRFQMLAKLYKDERSHQLPFFSVLQCVHMGRLLRPTDVQEFQTHLQAQDIYADEPHVLELAVIEHNLLAASDLYHTMSFDHLAELLKIPRERAESAASQMIYEDRLQGSIDQVDDVLVFNGRDKEGLSVADAKFETLCRAVDACCSHILAKYPKFTPA